MQAQGWHIVRRIDNAQPDAFAGAGTIDITVVAGGNEDYE